MTEGWRGDRGLLLTLFVLANLGFLSVDIRVAHAVNGFAQAAEWIPFWFSLAGTLVLGAATALRGRQPWLWRVCTWVVGAGAVLVGVAGLLLHLRSQFFQLQSLHGLVYTAPFAAPLAYCGLGLLLVLNLLERPGSPTWSAWVVFLALGGFLGNLALSLCDHAQNGFFYTSEWIPVASSAFALAFLAVALRKPGPGFYRLTLGVLALQAAVGLLGFALHLRAVANTPADSLFEQVVHGAPLFAPLLFPNLALLAAFGLWSGQHPSPAPPAEPSGAG